MKNTFHTLGLKSIPDGARVRVHGFPMLKGLKDGDVRIVRRDEAKQAYWFCVPRTGRTVVGHYMSNVDPFLQGYPRGDLNCLEVLP